MGVKLNQTIRWAVYKLAEQILRDKKVPERLAFEKAQKNLISMLDKAVAKMTTTQERAVLKKFEALREYNYLFLNCAATGIKRHTRAYDHKWEIPNNKQAVPVEMDVIEAIDDLESLSKTYEGWVTDRLADYKTLVDTVKTLEEVIAVFPEAEKCRPAPSREIAVLTEDVIKRIMADQTKK